MLLVAFALICSFTLVHPAALSQLITPLLGHQSQVPVMVNLAKLREEIDDLPSSKDLKPLNDLDHESRHIAHGHFCMMNVYFSKNDRTIVNTDKTCVQIANSLLEVRAICDD